MPRPLQVSTGRTATATTAFPEPTLQPDAQLTETAAPGELPVSPVPTVQPTVMVGETPITIIVPTPEPRSDDGIWLAQQSGRESFESPRQYWASVPVSLYWFDPRSSQQVEVGRLIGEFTATAQFGYIPQGGSAALEVPYHINQDYGLTAISSALRERMAAVAGDEGYIQTFVFLNESVSAVSGSS